MRNKHLLEQFMKENGLEFDVPFNATFKSYTGREVSQEIYIHKADDRYIGFTVNYADNGELVEDDRFEMLDLLFSDRVKIVKKPWKPKKDNVYWSIWFVKDGKVDITSTYWKQTSIDFTRYIAGNCFKTEEEAKKHKDDVLKILKGEPLVKWEG